MIFLMFTAYEVIIFVTSHASGSELKKTEDHFTLDFLKCEVQCEETFSISQSEHKLHWGRVQDNAAHLK